MTEEKSTEKKSAEQKDNDTKVVQNAEDSSSLKNESDTHQEEGKIPEKRFKEVTSKLKSLEAEIAKRDLEKAEADKKAKEKKEEWEKLYQETKPKAEKAEKLEKVLTDVFEAERASLPEEAQSKIDKLTEGMSVEDKIKHIRELKDVLVPKNASVGSSRLGNNGKATDIPNMSWEDRYRRVKI